MLKWKFNVEKNLLELLKKMNDKKKEKMFIDLFLKVFWINKFLWGLNLMLKM